MSSSPFINVTRLSGTIHSANTSKKVTNHKPPSYGNSHYSSAMGSSWPPTQLRLREMMTLDDDNDVPILERNLDFMDDDPLTYFLTPTKEEDDPMMEFDAGINESSTDVIRSISPSQLDGGKKSGSAASASSAFARPPTPPRSPPALGESTDEEMEDDDDEYIRLSPSQGMLPLSLSDFAKEQALLRSASFPSRSQRGRRATYTANSSRRRLSPRSWREPSPDVWSIEEEPEDSGAPRAAEEKKKVASDGKPKKRVRFVLPVGEESFH